MPIPRHRVFAIRYGRHERTAKENFISVVGDPNRPMPMDYFIWLIGCADGRSIVVDTGFDEAVAARRGRKVLRSPIVGLAALGVDVSAVGDVLVTHLHYDHVGNTRAFPRARFWVQEKELHFTTGRYMCHGFFRLAYEPTEVAAMIDRLFDGSVFPVDGDVEVVPGVSLHWVGGHTAGLQVVRVHTEAGWLVLASDLMHYYENFQAPNLFPVVYRPEEVLDGFTRVRSLASDPRLIVPGHDPEVMKRFAAEPADAEHTVRLWLPNQGSG